MAKSMTAAAGPGPTVVTPTDLLPKKQNFTAGEIQAIIELLNTCDRLGAYKAQWDANGYATGASPVENNITDEDLSVIAPYMTAVQLNQAIGAVETIRGTIAANRGYLEAVRS